MQPILSAALNFPTIVFTFVLGLLALYWLLVLIRLAPLELFERDSLRDDHMASTLVSLGFIGVPATLALTVLMLLAGALSLALELLVLRWLDLGMLRVPLGVVILWATLAVASPLAAVICQGMARGLYRFAPFKRRSLLGVTVKVTALDGAEHAEAVVEGKPGCKVNLHCKQDDFFTEGERRVLVKYLKEEGAYRSVEVQTYMETRQRLNQLRLRHKHQETAHSN
ncbi:hypothetical protein RN346_12045 [Halomonas sp. PAMB 3232]|uniref:hypothetical protein n=1 Tax=Halomonas sp. PAMB 3232 TaxID=3075221 RepID=UPI00289B2F84|nr:hypothetical protein [Halomonas sp. PAMB 3232]WNL38019.1 hypothetical protein RN346_12045 [Halomonas sp. PAMB 3232]